jgi:hypothetical protein
MSDPVSNEATPIPATIEQVHAEFEKLLRDRNCMGVRNLLGDTFLDTRNPFQRTRRAPKKWVVAVLAIILFALLIAYWFHFR